MISLIIQNHINEDEKNEKFDEEGSFPSLLNFLTSLPSSIIKPHYDNLITLLSTANLDDLNYAYLIDSITTEEIKKVVKPKPITESKVVEQPLQSLKDIRITQVSQIFPTLGLGYIELALACYGNSVEGTCNALAGEKKDLHRRLTGVDEKLPMMRKESEKNYGGLKDEGVKEYVKNLEIEEERIAKLQERINEYDDDYDDQYDNSGGIGDDYEAVMEYNRSVKEGLREGGFWEEMKNLNKVKGKKGKKKVAVGEGG
ncbi:hypothetical protein TL16_g00935 [Triparma laevis f. inornata]|nr:hypothetical protein TL16_g00935 [Triparma laevis f. inornata]